MEDFARVQRGDFNPADCIRCGRDTDLLDLGAGDKRGYGRPYLCVICFGELADKMEYVTPQEQAAIRSALGTQILGLSEELEAAHRSITALNSEIAVSPAVVLERFAADVSRLVSSLPGSDRGPADVAVPVPAEAGAAPVGRSDGDDGADGGVADATPRAARKPAGRPARNRPRPVETADEGDAGLPSADVDNDIEGDGAGPSDLDEWATSLGDFDGEAALVHGGDAGD